MRGRTAFAPFFGVVLAKIEVHLLIVLLEQPWLYFRFMRY